MHSIGRAFWQSLVSAICASASGEYFASEVKFHSIVRGAPSKEIKMGSQLNSAVPLLDLRLQYLSLKNEIDRAVMSVVESQSFILGPEVESFEREVSEYCESRFALGVSSGTDALLLALMAFDISPGDEVLTSPYTFFATAGSIARLGARPVFVDIDPTTFNLQPQQLAARCSSRTKAIMPVHIFGQCCDMGEVIELAKAKNLRVIEDAAQAIGSRERGVSAGAIGDVGCFSFFPSKNLGAFGDAGLVTTSDENTHAKMKKLRVHGAADRYYHDLVGANFRIDALQAAVLRVKLRHLDMWSESRRQNAAKYRKLFHDSGIVGMSLEEAAVVLPQEAPNKRHIYNQFVVRVRERDRLQKYLTDKGIGNAVYYPVPLHLQRCFESLGYRPGDFPESERAAKETLALPIYPELTDDQLARVVESMESFYKHLVA